MMLPTELTEWQWTALIDANPQWRAKPIVGGGVLHVDHGGHRRALRYQDSCGVLRFFRYGGEQTAAGPPA